MAINTVTIEGTLGKDPELKFTPGGHAVANFSVAVQDRAKKEGEQYAPSSWFDVVVWRDQAENVAECLKKGARVVVSGKLEQQSWEKDGQKFSRVQINAFSVAPSLAFAQVTIKKAERTQASAAPAVADV